MDPERVRAYLQVACAGLGFDIGEIWWSTNEEHGSAIAAIEEKSETSTALTTTEHHNKLRFVQLYTSKSYENRRSELVRPSEEEEEEYQKQGSGSSSSSQQLTTQDHDFHEDSSNDLKKHVLSPTLVEAISKKAQVIWAHTRKSEGLTGRSDIRLQTAVGMPVAVDRDGNMCVVVMFSPNNIQSTDDALEYLQNISRSATSTSIPALLPAFDPRQGLISIPHYHSTNEVMPMLSNVLRDGVTTRFVPLDQDDSNHPRGNHSTLSAEVHSSHDLENAPRDCFGIPMLPAVAELANTRQSNTEAYGDSVSDAFDEASYGVWSTIMQSLDPPDVLDDISQLMQEQHVIPLALQQSQSPDGTLYADRKPYMAPERQERLEEFANAFLGVSVFELAEVWLPLGPQSDCLGLVTSVMNENTSNVALRSFKTESERVLVKFWSGAVGRAYSSGNPVWSTNREIFADTGRVTMFRRAKIESALAVPIYSGKSKTPAFVFCCYSFVRTGSVPFVLKFVQQALKLLWSGLDKVEPHESVGAKIWREVAPADLGEMAADVEMQEHFLIKKRPRSESFIDRPSQQEMHQYHQEQHEQEEDYELETSIAAGIASLEAPSGSTAVPTIYTGQDNTNDFGQHVDIQPIQYQAFESTQNHIQDVRSVSEMDPMNHQHITTTADGSKRAHIYQQEHFSQAEDWSTFPSPLPSPNFGATTPGIPPAISTAPSPLPLPTPLPTHVMQPLRPTEFPPAVFRGPTPDAVQDIPIPAHQGQQYNQSYIHTYASVPNQINRDPIPTQVVSLHTDEEFALPPAPFAPEQQQQQQQQFAQYGYQTVQQQMYAQSPGHPAHMANGFDQNSSVPIFCLPIMESPAAIAEGKTALAGTAAVIMVPNQNGKICRIQGCTEAAVPRRPYCQHHSGSRMCEHAGCNKCAQGSTRFCIAHGGGRRCTHPGCDKGARDKFFCAAHGGGKRCKYLGCSKSAVGGSSFCTSHGGGKRCSVDGCDKSAQSSTNYCVKHGGGKKCMHPGCEKVARGRTQYCAAHGGGIRCKLAGCNRVAIGKMQLCRAHGGGSRAKVAPPTMEEQHETQDMEPVMLQPQLQAPAGDPNFQYQTQEHQQQQTSYYAGSI